MHYDYSFGASAGLQCPMSWHFRFVLCYFLTQCPLLLTFLSVLYCGVCKGVDESPLLQHEQQRQGSGPSVYAELSKGSLIALLHSKEEQLCQREAAMAELKASV